MNIAADIERIRVSKNLSQEQMAAELDISQQVYSNIENGRTKRIDPKIIQYVQQNIVKSVNNNDDLPTNLLKDQIILHLVETNRRLVDNTVDLTQMTKDSWAKRDESERRAQNRGQIDLTALRILARVTWHGKYQSEEQAFDLIKQDYYDLIELQEIERERKEIRNAGAGVGSKKVRKTESVGMKHKQK